MQLILLLMSLQMWPAIKLSKQVEFQSDKEMQDKVDKVAEIFGNELWELGEIVARPLEIKEKYEQMFNESQAHVGTKNVSDLLDSVVNNITKMLQTKIDAVNCIARAAEEIAKIDNSPIETSKNFTYYSSKFSNVIEIDPTHCQKQRPPPCLFKHSVELRKMYRLMWLRRSPRYRNLYVNTTHSSVYVPTDLYDYTPRILHAVNWTQQLDEVFRKNHRTFPSLSWQYFGSNTGILRHFPAQEWERNTDQHKSKGHAYDSRSSAWYNRATICSQDIVILLDNSGSMSGHNSGMAALTIKTILGTLTSDDYFSVLIYPTNDNFTELLNSTKDTLIPGTLENVNMANEAIHNLHPENYANAESTVAAIIKALDLLKEHREKLKCLPSACKQGIVIVTDSLAEDLVVPEIKMTKPAEISPMVIYVFLIGKGKLDSRQEQLMKQLNVLNSSHGGFSYFNTTLSEVSGEVLKFADFMRNNMLDRHSNAWTSAFVDQTLEQDTTTPRMVLAFSAAAFDHSPHFLGVVGTNVPVDEIKMHTLPYKLGVNGYSFIINNNGYMILHPELRIGDDGSVRDNYNTIDFTEIEHIVEVESDSVIRDLRGQMINSETGHKSHIPVLLPIDRLQRISLEYMDYYFARLPNTPFTLGLVLPSLYGNSAINAGDIIATEQKLGLNISENFSGNSWRVHPEWIYCKYHYLEQHIFDNPEEELRHFLQKMMTPDWMWQEQFEPGTSNNISIKPVCDREPLHEDAYYCNKELLDLLLFDAKVTNSSFNTWKFTREQEYLIKLYKITLRFVATTSGLTRWQPIIAQTKIEERFGDSHKKAIDEAWYKRAILQHNAFIYSVSYDAHSLERKHMSVTASVGVFPSNGTHITPGCVVGFQLSNEQMHNRFLNISNFSGLSCESEWNCFVIDDNGYIVLSSDFYTVGLLFEKIEPDVMRAAVEGNIFKQHYIYDTQAHCPEHVSNGSSLLFSPFQLIFLGLKWIVGELLIKFMRFKVVVSALNTHHSDIKAHDCKILKNEPDTHSMFTTSACCEKVRFYTLENDKYNDTYLNDVSKTAKECRKKHYIKKIPHTNLLLVVVEAANNCITKFTPPRETKNCRRKIPTELSHRRFECSKARA